jgi:hypothetical protein
LSIVLISISPSLEIHALYPRPSERRTRAASSPPLRYIGDGKTIVVATEASSEMLTSSGFKTTSPNG